MSIEGLSHAAVLSIMSEIWSDGFIQFDTSKQFVSRARLAPNNKISGGKVFVRKTPKGSNRLKIALRQTANAIRKLKDTHLSDFFKRVASRKGRQVTVSATARKPGVIIWTIITKQVPYNLRRQYLFLDQKIRTGIAKKF